VFPSKANIYTIYVNLPFSNINKLYLYARIDHLLHGFSSIATPIFIDSGCCYVGQWAIIKYDNKMTTLFLKLKQLASF
jgi:hypothetical protein